jgi:proline racemase
MSDDEAAARCIVVLVTSPETPHGIQTPAGLYAVAADGELEKVTVNASNPYTAASDSDAKVTVNGPPVKARFHVSGDRDGLVLLV